MLTLFHRSCVWDRLTLGAHGFDLAMFGGVPVVLDAVDFVDLEGYLLES